MNYRFYCDKCQYGTNLKDSFEKHKKSTLHITGKRKSKPKKIKEIYKCEHCEYESTNKNNYLTHFLNNHSNKQERKNKFPFYCEKCDFGVFTDSSYNKHLITKKHKIRQI